MGLFDLFLAGGIWSCAVTALGLGLGVLGALQLTRHAARDLSVAMVATGLTLFMVAALGTAIGRMWLLAALDSVPAEQVAALTRAGLAISLAPVLLALGLGVPGTVLAGVATHRARRAGA